MIFLDTSAVVALANRSDERHAEAIALFSSVRDPGEFATHNYVMVEAFALLHRRLGLRVALRFEEGASAFEVVWVDRRLHEAAVRTLARKGTRRSSLVDEISFLVMRERGIDTAFAFDPDFEREGFKTLG
ncbi:MAG: PIN domain-containing protein [Thermoanaerobaculia bacterium]